MFMTSPCHIALLMYLLLLTSYHSYGNMGGNNKKAWASAKKSSVFKFVYDAVRYVCHQHTSEQPKMCSSDRLLDWIIKYASIA